jgi:hypothetical protein
MDPEKKIVEAKRRGQAGPTMHRSDNVGLPSLNSSSAIPSNNKARWPSGLRRCVQDSEYRSPKGRGFESHSCHKLLLLSWTYPSAVVFCDIVNPALPACYLHLALSFMLFSTSSQPTHVIL